MERSWVFGRLAVTVARIDFLDPAVADQSDARERGVRIEVRPATFAAVGSVYVSPTWTLEPAICRIDLLESAPGAADRMHWHPEMPDGEPGERTFDAGMPADPVGWLTAFLLDLGGFLTRSGHRDVAELGRDLEEIRATAPEIGADVAAGLLWARGTPWPEVDRDERGMPALRP